MPWAIKYDQTNRLDGHRVGFYGPYGHGEHDFPVQLSGHNTAVFRTRDQARKYCEKHWGYIRDRPDLKAEPHCWRVPKVVKVEVHIEEIP